MSFDMSDILELERTIMDETDELRRKAARLLDLKIELARYLAHYEEHGAELVRRRSGSATGFFLRNLRPHIRCERRGYSESAGAAQVSRPEIPAEIFGSPQTRHGAAGGNQTAPRDAADIGEPRHSEGRHPVLSLRNRLRLTRPTQARHTFLYLRDARHSVRVVLRPRLSGIVCGRPRALADRCRGLDVR
jgi:hypothetical protein